MNSVQTRLTEWRPDAVSVLSLYIVLLFCLPARLVVPSMGAAGRPADLFGLVLLGWWVLYGLVPKGFPRKASPLTIALRIRDARGAKQDAKDAYLEELLVRRELSMNFVAHNPQYDTYRCLPHWAKATLATHKADAREYVYTARQLEEARTHDPYWNAAMREMVVTGKMANYMRMYWGKKILEWTRTPEFAFRTALRLNNRYFLDGRNPNSFAGVAWCFGKHDRPWQERPIFGTVRYMSAGGLKRKFDIDGYVEQVSRLA